VESSATPLVVTGPVTVERVKDSTLPKGERVVEEAGSAPTRTSATRNVYSPDGELIRSETWTTSYEGEERVIRVGTKVEPKTTKPVPKAPADDAEPPPDPTTPTTPRP
jgi:uncharacterized protein YabE (DUF348 family)